MSQLYNHNSGDYQDYLAVRAQEQTQLAIKKASQQQTIATAVCTTHLSNRLDNVSSNISEMNNNLVRMETGIKTSIDQNTYAVVASSQILQHTFLSGFDSINNTLDMGFAGVSSAIGELASAVSAGFTHLSKQMSEMQNEICDRLDKIHDIVNNPVLTQSREMYRRAATNYEKGFFEEALEDIKQAVEKNRTDYISWYLMGKIYLYGVSQFSNTVNLDEAVNSFTNAAKYITPDLTESQDAVKLASEIYYNYAFTYYVKATQKLLNNEDSSEDLKKSIDLAVQSNTLSNKMLESLYMVARCEELLGNREKVLKLADQLIEEDSYYALKFVDDPDFSEARQDIFDLIEEKRKTLYNSFAGNIDKLKTYLNNYEFHDTPFAQQVLSDLQMASKINEKTPYLDLVYSKINHSYLVKMFENEDFPCDRLLSKEEEEIFYKVNKSKIEKCINKCTEKKYSLYDINRDAHGIDYYIRLKKNEDIDETEKHLAQAYIEDMKAKSESFGFTKNLDFICKIKNDPGSWNFCCGIEQEDDEYKPFFYCMSNEYTNYQNINPIKLDSDLSVYISYPSEYSPFSPYLENNYLFRISNKAFLHICNFDDDCQVKKVYVSSIKTKKEVEEENNRKEEENKRIQEENNRKQEEKKRKQEENLRNAKKKAIEDKIKAEQSEISNAASNVSEKIEIAFYIAAIGGAILGLIFGGSIGRLFAAAIGMTIGTFIIDVINIIFMFKYYKSGCNYYFYGDITIWLGIGYALGIGGIVLHFVHGFFKKLLFFIIAAAIVAGVVALISAILNHKVEKMGKNYYNNKYRKEN